MAENGRIEAELIDLIALVERNVVTASLSGRRYGHLGLVLNRRIEILPAQFAMIKPRRLSEPLLRRAMAFYRVRNSESQTIVEFIYQIVGRGTESLTELQPGEEVAFLGPLGNTFSEGQDDALLVAGGAGSPALFMLAEELIKDRRSVHLFIGGASKGDLCGLSDFETLLGMESITAATIDGSYGIRGLVSQPLETYLSRVDRASCEVFSCGPEPMLDRVSQLCAQFEIPAQLSLESPMACGFGICVGCAVAVKANVAEGFVYKRVCVDGPVFRSDELYSLKTMHSA